MQTSVHIVRYSAEHFSTESQSRNAHVQPAREMIASGLIKSAQGATQGRGTTSSYQSFMYVPIPQGSKHLVVSGEG